MIPYTSAYREQVIELAFCVQDVKNKPAARTTAASPKLEPVLLFARISLVYSYDPIAETQADSRGERVVARSEHELDRQGKIGPRVAAVDSA